MFLYSSAIAREIFLTLVVAACPGALTFQITGIACTAVLVDDSVVQLLLVCGLHTLSFLLLVVFKPFANRRERP